MLIFYLFKIRNFFCSEEEGKLRGKKSTNLILKFYFPDFCVVVNLKIKLEKVFSVIFLGFHLTFG